MIKNIDTEDRETLEATLDNVRDEPESNQIKNKIDDDPSTRPDIESKLTRVENIIKSYEDVITLSDELVSIVAERSKNVKLTFNKDQQTTLRDSIRRVFGIDTDVVTYDMYKQCLETKESLDDEDRQTMRTL